MIQDYFLIAETFDWSRQQYFWTAKKKTKLISAPAIMMSPMWISSWDCQYFVNTELPWLQGCITEHHWNVRNWKRCGVSRCGRNQFYIWNVNIFYLFQTAAVSLSLATPQIYPTSWSTPSLLLTSSTPAGLWSTQLWAGRWFWSVGWRTWATELSVLKQYRPDF